MDKSQHLKRIKIYTRPIQLSRLDVKWRACFMSKNRQVKEKVSCINKRLKHPYDTMLNFNDPGKETF